MFVDWQKFGIRHEYVAFEELLLALTTGGAAWSRVPGRRCSLAA
jgi:hypothetical protein